MRTLSLVALLAAPVVAQDPAAPKPVAASDRELVRQAVLDYVEGVYQAAPERIERSVDPSLVKLGFGKRDDQPYRELKMTYEQLVELAGEWNAKKWLPADAPKQVAVLDVLPRIACAKLTAHWGTDYFQLLKGDDERWRIRHVLWQTPPPEMDGEARDEARRQVEQAARNYVQAFYLTEPELIDEGVHVDLAKFGYYRRGAEMQPAPMDFTQLKALVDRVAGSMPKDGRQEVTLLDVQDQTAIVKLAAEWGIDYMHVAKFDGKWQTVHVVWQSHPQSAPAPVRGESPPR